MASKLMAKLVGLMPGLDDVDGAGAEGQMLARWEPSWLNAADQATTTAVSERVVFRAKRKSRVVGCWFIPTSAVTGAATNFFSLLVDKRAATAYGTPVNLITYAADTPTDDDAAAFTPKDIGPGVATYPVADKTVFDLLRGDVVTVEVTKAGTGMTFPVSQVVFQVEPRD